MSSSSSSSPLDMLFHVGRGFLMGTAEIIPGVSGGTVALIVGVYDRLIEAISQSFVFLFTLLRFDRKQIVPQFRAIDWTLIIPLLIGMGSAIVLLAQLLEHLLETYPVECRGLFFGLIAASVAIPWLRISQKTPTHYACALAACLFAYFASSLAPQEITDPSYLQIFGGASIAICAMILPGVSGAFLLLVFGLYAPTMAALNARDIPYILTFMLGAATGMGLFSRLLKWLLNHRHDITMAVLTGLMLGSLRALWPWQACEELIVPEKSEPVVTNCQMLLPGTGDPFLNVILLAIGGFTLVTFLVWREHSQQPTHTST